MQEFYFPLNDEHQTLYSDINTYIVSHQCSLLSLNLGEMHAVGPSNIQHGHVPMLNVTEPQDMYLLSQYCIFVHYPSSVNKYNIFLSCHSIYMRTSPIEQWQVSNLINLI